MIANAVEKIFLSYSDVLYGYANISYSDFYKQYKSALVFAVSYTNQLSIKNYSELAFDKGITGAKNNLNIILDKIEGVLQKELVHYYIPSVVQNNEKDLEAPFSFKYAAVNAGLGWIGKSDVLITEKYGPRIRLAAILIDEILPYGKPITNSKCPEDCSKCVDICPYKAIYGVKWDIGKYRNELIDYKLCNQKRSQLLQKRGRKSACGLCMVVCPYGL
jgi:Uncharacterized Fe-S protein